MNEPQEAAARPEGSWLDLELLDPPRPDTVIEARAGDVGLAAVQVADGALRVFRDTCTHAECAFTDYGEVEEGVLICNCHGAEFDLADGAVLQDPAEVPLQMLPVREHDGRLQVRLAD